MNRQQQFRRGRGRGYGPPPQEHYSDYSSYEDQGPSKSHSSGKSRGQASRKGYQDRRMEAHRVKTGNKYLDELNASIKSELFVATKDGEMSALEKVQENMTLKAITLSITTRGIGLGICHLSFISVNYHEIQGIPSIYAQFRVYLGVLEAKLEAIKSEYTLVPRFQEHCYQYIVSSNMLQSAKTMTVCPEPIKRIVNAVGIIKHGDVIYLPAVAKSMLDRNDHFVPQTGNILLSNLRQTVEALSNQETPLRYRERFERNNPIPGAIWNNHILTNADEIIPNGYTDDDFKRELLMVGPYMNKLQKHVPKMVSGNIDFKGTGNPSLFVANEPESLRAPNRNVGEALNDYYRRCIPEGNVKTYTSLHKIEAAARLDGQVNLLGEHPNTLNASYPIYHMRDEAACPFEIASDYLGVCAIKYAL